MAALLSGCSAVSRAPGAVPSSTPIAMPSPVPSTQSSATTSSTSTSTTAVTSAGGGFAAAQDAIRSIPLAESVYGGANGWIYVVVKPEATSSDRQQICSVVKQDAGSEWSIDVNAFSP